MDKAPNLKNDTRGYGQSNSQVSVSSESGQNRAREENRDWTEVESKKPDLEAVISIAERCMTEPVTPTTKRGTSKFGITQSSPKSKVDASLPDQTESPVTSRATFTSQSNRADSFERWVSDSVDNVNMEANMMGPALAVSYPGDLKFETLLGSFFDNGDPKRDSKKALVLLPSDKSPLSPKNRSLSNKSTEIDATRLEHGQDDGESNAADLASESEVIDEACEINMRGALDTAMNVVKNLLLQELLEYSLPEARNALPLSADGVDASDSSNSSSQGSSKTSAACSNVSSQCSDLQTAQNLKRMRGSGRDLDNDGDESDEDGRPKKKNGKTPPARIPHRRLKCPFYQRDPDRYTKAACRGEGFTDMAKLKDRTQTPGTNSMSRHLLTPYHDLKTSSVCIRSRRDVRDAA
jgi:hypothetical protein